MGRFGLGSEYYCTSVDDAKMSIRKATNIKGLKAALVGERENNNRATLIKALEARIRKLEKEAKRV